MPSRRTGYASLPLHGGKAPAWLFGRMSNLSREILSAIACDHGASEILRRLSDPYWFQAFGCVLGFDWHSSGVTTTVCGAVKEGLRGLEADLGLFVAGGKGAVSRRTPAEIQGACEHLGREPAPLIRASRLAAKVDSAAIQDGYQLYHHCFFVTAAGEWCVVQQGMSDATRTARRYHWLSERVKNFVDEPHEAVCCDERVEGLNLVASESGPARDASATLARDRPEVALDALVHVPDLRLPARHVLLPEIDVDQRHLRQILLKTASTRDPARFAFAHGGKDGIPFPVDRPTYDRTVKILHDALHRAAVDRSEKVRAFRRLAAFGQQSSLS
jgi:hypothetical protein